MTGNLVVVVAPVVVVSVETGCVVVVSPETGCVVVVSPVVVVSAETGCVVVVDNLSIIPLLITVSFKYDVIFTVSSPIIYSFEAA